MKLFLTFLTVISLSFSTMAEDEKTLKIIHVAGGCCHDYENQKNILKEGLEKRINCKVDLFVEGKSKTHIHSLFKKKDWSKGYDLVLFNICFGGVTDDEFIKGVVAETAKDGKGAVFLHCSLHTFRNAKSGTEEYRKLLGLSSQNHGKKSPILVENMKETHPIMKDFPKMWQTPNGELYNIFAQGEKAEILANGHYPDDKKTQACIWTNLYKESKIFGMSLGHHNETMQAKEYQDVLSRGVLWTVGKLQDDGKAAQGYAK